MLTTAPMLGLTAVRGWSRVAQGVARAACLVGLAAVQVQRYDPFGLSFERTVLTHDRARYDRSMAQLRACPDLALGGPTFGWMDYALGAGARLNRPEVAARFSTPLTVIGAQDDRLVSSADAQAFAEAAPHGRYVRADGAMHEILMETDAVRDLFWREFDALVRRIGFTLPSA
jgi:lysophospholipase